MITKIEVKNFASFDVKGSVLNNLEEVNYIYGANGSGKTTISSVIADIQKFPQCSIEWKNNKELKTFVYNREFVNDNFVRSKNLKGVFTLGKAEKDVKNEIEAKKAEIEKLKNIIEGNVKSINNNVIDRDSNEEHFESVCWTQHTLYKEEFSTAFIGCAYKKNFKERCKTEINNTSNLLTIEVLKDKAKRIYKGTTDLKQDISLIDIENLEDIEANEIWSKRIIGKEDVDLAAMIKKLENSGWVKQGRQYFSINDEICPFCQQMTPSTFEQQLNDYFDETYLNQISNLQIQKTDYKSVEVLILSQISTLLDSKNDMIDNVHLEELRKILELKIEANKAKIESKIKDPSSIINLESLKDVLGGINIVIQTGKVKVKSHNDIVENLSKEKKQLTNEIWRYISEKIKSDYQAYLNKDQTCKKAINGLEISKKENESKQKIIESEIADLERESTSIEHTKTEINDMLRKFGFTNFKLTETNEEKGSYQIIRLNGSRVERTLSEGEKTFIAFLYFYNLVKGSIEPGLVSIERVVVFDDPISSLDSDVLFVVSHLIRKIIEDIRNKVGNIKQIIILTHNIYFHKEVTYNKGKGVEKLKSETFWIVRKENDISKLKYYDYNPIKTSYELLWKELKDNPNSITIQNTLRRIIENYFKLFGGVSNDEIIDKLDNEDKISANSLLSWSHAGSHGINDDLYVSNDSNRHLEVFRNIFEKTKHIEHYNMMMGINIENEEIN